MSAIWYLLRGKRHKHICEPVKTLQHMKQSHFYEINLSVSIQLKAKRNYISYSFN